MPTSPRLSDRGLTWWLRHGFRGFNTLHLIRHQCGGARRILRRTIYGSVFAFDPFSYIDRIVLREGYYESEVMEALKPFLDGSAVLWDIGGNFGLHSITAKLLSSQTKVFAFEPNPTMADAIKSNAKLNDVSIDVVPYALGDMQGARTFYVNSGGNPGMSTLHAWDGGNYDREMVVQCERAEDLVARNTLPAPTVVKLDVEGGEAEVLKGMGALLQRPELRAIIFEASAGLSPASQNEPIVTMLRGAGFHFSPLVRREKSKHSLDNYLAIKTR